MLLPLLSASQQPADVSESDGHPVPAAEEGSAQEDTVEAAPGEEATEAAPEAEAPAVVESSLHVEPEPSEPEETSTPVCFRFFPWLYCMLFGNIRMSSGSTLRRGRVVEYAVAV